MNLMKGRGCFLCSRIKVISQLKLESFPGMGVSSLLSLRRAVTVPIEEGEKSPSAVDALRPESANYSRENEQKPGNTGDTDSGQKERQHRRWWERTVEDAGCCSLNQVVSFKPIYPTVEQVQDFTKEGF